MLRLGVVHELDRVVFHLGFFQILAFVVAVVWDHRGVELVVPPDEFSVEQVVDEVSDRLSVSLDKLLFFEI